MFGKLFTQDEIPLALASRLQPQWGRGLPMGRDEALHHGASSSTAFYHYTSRKGVPKPERGDGQAGHARANPEVHSEVAHSHGQPLCLSITCDIDNDDGSHIITALGVLLNSYSTL